MSYYKDPRSFFEIYTRDRRSPSYSILRFVPEVKPLTATAKRNYCDMVRAARLISASVTPWVFKFCILRPKLTTVSIINFSQGASLSHRTNENILCFAPQYMLYCFWNIKLYHDIDCIYVQRLLCELLATDPRRMSISDLLALMISDEEGVRPQQVCSVRNIKKKDYISLQILNPNTSTPEREGYNYKSWWSTQITINGSERRMRKSRNLQSCSSSQKPNL